MGKANYLNTETAFAFGQYGSVFTDTTDPIFPPKDQVFVAITFLSDSTVAASGGLTAELDGSTVGKTEYIGDTVLAHDTGDTSSTASTSGSSTTLTLGAQNLAVKVGMIIESLGDADIPRSLTAPTTVEAYDGATTVTMSAAHNVSSQTVAFFHSKGSGRGGDVIDASNTFPKGITIYGRWTSLDLASGSAIAYIGD